MSELKSSLWSFWPVVVLWSHFSMNESLFCLSSFSAQMTWHVVVPMVSHYSTDGRNSPRNAAMCQQRPDKQVLAVNNAGFRILKKQLCKCVMRKEIYSTHFYSLRIHKICFDCLKKKKKKKKLQTSWAPQPSQQTSQNLVMHSGGPSQLKKFDSSVLWAEKIW